MPYSTAFIRFYATKTYLPMRAILDDTDASFHEAIAMPCSFCFSATSSRGEEMFLYFQVTDVLPSLLA